MKTKFILYGTLLCLISLTAESQTIFGKWQSIDAETGTTEATIEIFEEQQKAYAKIIDILNPDDKNKICIYCKGKNKDKPILGMIILEGLEKDGDEWNGGKIVDPKNGNSYKCYVKLQNTNTLKLRGYIGFSLFGRTEYWQRFEE